MCAQTVEKSLQTETLRHVLHAILFQRVLGTISARSTDFLNLTFVSLNDPALIALVESKVEAFVADSAASVRCFA